MLLGHFGVAFAAKKLAPRASLGTLFFASLFVDLLWPTLLLLGVESVRIESSSKFAVPLIFEDYPVSHSLVAVIGWAILIGAAHLAFRRDRRTALVVGAVVLSHWLLDLVVHAPDLPLAPWRSPKVGLALWSSLPFTAVVETTLYVLGAALYLKSTRDRDRTGTLAIEGLMISLFGIGVVNWLSAPPPSVTLIAVVGEAQWLFVLWSYWADKSRTVVTHR